MKSEKRNWCYLCGEYTRVACCRTREGALLSGIDPVEEPVEVLFDDLVGHDVRVVVSGPAVYEGSIPEVVQAGPVEEMIEAVSEWIEELRETGKGRGLLGGHDDTMIVMVDLRDEKGGQRNKIRGRKSKI